MTNKLPELRKVYDDAVSLAGEIQREMDEHTERGELFTRDPYKNAELERMKGALTNALPDIFGHIAAQEQRIEALERGLKPFAEQAEWFMHNDRDNRPLSSFVNTVYATKWGTLSHYPAYRIVVGDFRRADDLLHTDADEGE